MTIHIEVDKEEYLTVSNRISPKRKKEDNASGIGLKNLSNRCRLMTDKEMLVQNENDVFTVKIPIIQ